MSYQDVVLVTGAGRGLGKAISIALANEDVPVVCISKTNALKTCMEINQLEKRAIGLQLDISDYIYAESRIREFVAFSDIFNNDHNIKIGIVLNAGILGEGGEFWDTDLTQLPGFLQAVQEQLQDMIMNGVLQTILQLGTKKATV